MTRLRWSLLALILAVLTVWALDACFPPPLPTLAEDLSTVVVDRNDRPLRAFASRKRVWRFAVTADQVAPDYLQALFAFEDRHFFRHPGVNPAAVVRAGWQALASGRWFQRAATSGPVSAWGAPAQAASRGRRNRASRIGGPLLRAGRSCVTVRPRASRR